MWGKGLGSVLRIAVGTALGLPILLYLMQDRLLFFPQPLREEDLTRIRSAFPEAAEISIAADDGTALRGWLVRHSRDDPSPLLIYFGGNAEEVSWLIQQHARLPGWSLLLMNYRGYGASGGKPGETALFADALSIYDAMRVRPEFRGERVAVMGRSLGSGVAVYLASRRPLAGAILVTPYDSITSLAQAHYPYLPVRWLLKHPFDSLALAPSLRQRALVLAAEQDVVIPPRHARTLYEAWAGPKSWYQLPDTDHDGISDHPDYWPLIARFLQGIESP